jgi:CRISPR/Cas system-associated exonuclease Cas4 (RecB family)
MSYSHSSIKTYEDCPLKYKLTRIDHLSEPTGPAAERGKRIHAEFEDAVIGLGLMTPDISYWSDYINTLKTKAVKAEYELGLNHAWQPVAFNAKDVWLRGVLDVFTLDGDKAYVADYKTGKERDYGDQLKLYATMIMAVIPNVEIVDCEIIYSDLNKIATYPTYNRSQFEDLKTWVEGRIKAIEGDGIFAPRPSYNCRWCHFRKGNGGPCKW